MNRTLTQSLIADVMAGILVLRDRDGIAITAGLAEERARNIVAGLLGNYRIETVDPAPSDRLAAQAWAVRAALEPRQNESERTERDE